MNTEQIEKIRAAIRGLLLMVPTTRMSEPNFKIGQEALRLLDAAQPVSPDMSADQLRLHMGELTAAEVLIARAAIRLANSANAAQPVGDEDVREAVAHAKMVIKRRDDWQAGEQDTLILPIGIDRAFLETLIRAAQRPAVTEGEREAALNDFSVWVSALKKRTEIRATEEGLLRHEETIRKLLKGENK